jgi:hypothetical protein
MTECHITDATTPFPPEVDLVMSALEAGSAKRRNDHRGTLRVQYHVVASLQLFSDTPGTARRELYTRDIGPKSMGFITAQRLPLGYGGILELTDPDGQPARIHCTLLRCREVAPGWYEGALYFNREQPRFKG